MDILWVSDIPNTRKHKSNCLPPDTNTNTPLTGNDNDIILNSDNISQFKERNGGSRLSYTPSSANMVNGSTSNNEFTSTSSRRSRADTMPSSTLPPFLGLGNSTNLYSSISNVAQQRPNHNNRSDSLVTPLEDIYHSSGMSSPLDENATNSIASTLASLGLAEDDTVEESTPDNKANNKKSSYFDHALTRHRSFTVSSKENNRDMMSFNPFTSSTKPMDTSPSTITGNDNIIRRRPRAISLGIADLHHPIQQQQNSFSLFEPSFQHQRNTNIDLTDNGIDGNNLPLLYQPRNLFTHMDSHEEEEDHKMDMESMIPSRLSSPGFDMEPPAQTPSRALWLGNVNPSVSVPDLHKLFARYGRVESARILSDKECAFVNFETVESALAAKEDLVNRLGSKVGGTVVKVGFGKADVNVAMALTSDAGPNAQGPTRALWVGNIPANINPAVLRSLFQSYGNIESIRILSHKNCGFVNFERQEDAVRARKMLQNKEILGPGTGTVRIGFAKAPANNPDEIVQDVVISGNTITSYPAPVTPLKPSSSTTSLQNQEKLSTDASTSNTTQWATVLLMASMMMNATTAQQQQQQDGDSISTSLDSNTPSPSSSTQSNYQRLASERKLIMQQLGYTPKTDEVERIPIKYFSTIPPVLEFGVERKLGPLRLREIRKALDNGNAIPDIEHIAQECMLEIVELCSDYIGNTVVQKLFEYCCEETKLCMIERISPYLASIGIHKNGTWAAQKIIETAKTEQQIQLICWNIAPYVPLLLLDQFGNYVVQCCLRMGSNRNQYIFDAIVDNCWEIGQGRFGARAVRAILENPIVTKEQQIYVAASIMQNALLLTGNVNGSILLNWLLETSGLLGHFRTLCNPNGNNAS